MRRTKALSRSGLLAASLALFLSVIPAIIAGGDIRPAWASAPLPHAAILVANPASAMAGASVTLAGAGFASSTSTFTPTVTVVFTDANGLRATLGQTTTSSVGGAFNVQVTVPVTAATGPAVFSATDVSGTVATAPFDVRPTATKIVVTPNSGLPGATGTVTGSGFAVNQPIVLSFTQGTTVTTLSFGTVTTTNTGTFSAIVTTPGNAAAGAATILAQDHDSNSATAPFTSTRAGAPAVVVAPSSGPPGTTITITGTNFAVTQAVTLTLTQGSTALAVVSGITSTAAGSFTASTVIPTAAVSGTAVLTADDRSGNTAAAGLTVTPSYNVNNGPTTSYFAEGYTGQLSTNKRATFDETLTILNANPFTATAVITYLIQGSSQVVVTRSIAPDATLRESVNTDIGPDRIAAAIVSSPSKIFVERVIGRTGANGVRFDGDSSLGNSSLGATFYFAEGYTGISFQEYLTLANPGSSAAHVTVIFTPQAASAAGAPSEAFVVPAGGRITRNIRRDAGGISNKSVGMIVTSDQPIMAERVLYFGAGDGSAKFGSTSKAGIQTLSTQYYFAFGSAGGTGLAQRSGDQSFVTVLTPDLATASAKITAQFFDAAGHGLGSTSVEVAPGTRQTINVNKVIGSTSTVYATVLSSSTPFVAEKPQYFGGSPNEGMHPGVAPSGMPPGLKSVALPDLSLIGAAGEPRQQTVFLYNPTASTVTVVGTYYSGSGNKAVTYVLPPGRITTINVNNDAAGLPAGSLGAVFTVTSTGASDSFVATNIANTSDGHSYTGTQGVPSS